MLDWLIIGGGLHGTYFSRLLVEEGGVSRDRVRVLDPHAEPLARWAECTSATGMDFLRSPVVHHLDAQPSALSAFARRHRREPWVRFRGPTDRPSLNLFERHSREVIRERGLTELRLQGCARALNRHPSGFAVETERGRITARRVVLALGVRGPHWPRWASALKSEGANVAHLFDPGFRRVPADGETVLVGAGLSGAQAALALAREGQAGKITLVGQREIQVFPYDAEPCWMGPKCLDAYGRLEDLGERRRRIRAARRTGTMPSEIASELRGAISRGEIRWLGGTVLSAQSVVEPNGQDGTNPRLEISVDVAGETRRLLAERLILATGFDPERPGGPWLDRAIADLGLSCAACGYPIVDKRLAWHPGLHVTGALAELEIGPIARNILGARLAGRRLGTA